TAALSPTDRSEARRLQEGTDELQKQRQSVGKIQALYDVGPPPPTYLLKRGNYETPGPEVQPGFPCVLCDSDKSDTVAPAPGPTTGRRTALAHWLSSPDTRASGLLGRVMVNRLWQHLFGRGLVATPENFGLAGEPPTHPELLEWLNSEFARNGW